MNSVQFQTHRFEQLVDFSDCARDVSVSGLRRCLLSQLGSVVSYSGYAPKSTVTAAAILQASSPLFSELNVCVHRAAVNDNDFRSDTARRSV